MSEQDVSHSVRKITNILSHRFSEVGTVAEQLISVPENVGKGKIRRIIIKEGLECIITDIEMARDVTHYIDDTCNFLEMNYCLSGETICEINGRMLHILEPTCHVYYSGHTKGRLKTKANSRSRTVEIRMSPETLLSYFDAENDEQKVREMLLSKHGKITAYSMSPIMKKCIFDILHCPYSGPVKKMYMEAKVMELITLYLRESAFCVQHSSHLLASEDIKKLKKAKNIALDHLDNPYSMKALAKKTELNEFKLKTGFKQLFGTTVFGLIRSRRMEKAAYLMKVEGYNVSETATAIGYSNLSNFTTAFRKQFGCNPSEYLKVVKDPFYRSK